MTSFACRLDYRPLAERRRRLNLSRLELAALVGCSQQILWRAETGRRDLRASVLMGCARALGTPMHELFAVREL